MKEYFDQKGPKYLGRTPTSLPTALNKDLKNLAKTNNSSINQKPNKLTNSKELNQLREMAQNRDEWRQFTQDIIRSNHNLSRNK